MLKTFLVFRLCDMPQEVSEALWRMYREHCFPNGCFFVYDGFLEGERPEPGSDRSIVEAWFEQSPHLAGIWDGVECPDVLIHHSW